MEQVFALDRQSSEKQKAANTTFLKGLEAYMERIDDL
jgi:hypothetical protein